MSAASPPFAGRRIALLHPAWHSCGTYRVVLGQIAAYRALGAEVVPVAISLDPGFPPQRGWIWKAFLQATPELDVGPRFVGGAPLHAVFGPRFVVDVLWPYLHGDQAVVRLGMVERAELSPGVTEQAYDLVHCNHFFLMPMARRLAGGAAPILLDTHDLQARQFALMNERMPWLHPRTSYETMLERELAAMRGADLLLHLNATESQEFATLLPDKRHQLLYPATPSAPTGPGGPDIVLVASNNAANVESVIWFLQEVAPRAPDVAVKIAGNVDAGVRARAPQLFAANAARFLGRVDDPGAVYAAARLVLLPTISGHGLSIKTVEALSSGLPLIATPQAMRGMGAEALTLPGVRIAEGAEAFAAAMRDLIAAGAPPDATTRRASATRVFYDTYFSQAAYERNLAALVAPLLDG